MSRGGVEQSLLLTMYFDFFMGDNMDGLSFASASLASLCSQLEVTFVGGKYSVLIKQIYAFYVFQNNCLHEFITDTTRKNRKTTLRKYLLFIKTSIIEF